MPFAQSSELPPPSATMRVDAALPAAIARPASTMPAVGIGVEVVKAALGDPGRAKRSGRPVHVAGRDNAGIRNEQGVPEAQLAGQRPETIERAVAEDDAGGETESRSLKSEVGSLKRCQTSDFKPSEFSIPAATLS